MENSKDLLSPLSDITDPDYEINNWVKVGSPPEQPSFIEASLTGLKLQKAKKLSLKKIKKNKQKRRRK